MKSRRLTETDLANMAFQRVETKRLRLGSILRPKKIVGSYEPFRATVGDALNQQFPFFAEEMDATPLGKLEEAVGRACKGDSTLLEMNLAIARSTHEYAQQQGLTAERVYTRPVTLAFGHTYEFGAPLLLRSATRAFTFFPDLRRTNQLSPMGCRFVFSMMHQRWRENDPDMSNLGLVVWRYQNNVARSIRPIECLGSALLSYEELSSDVRETYEILHELMHAQASDKRGDAAHPGPLFGTA